MKTPKFLLLSFGFVVMHLSFPLWAQEIGAMQKFNCPYCSMANSATRKFCGVCGSRLSATERTAYFYNASDFTLKRSAHPLDFQSESPAGLLVGTGLLAGALGFFAGGFTGAEIDKASSDGYEEWDGLAGFVVGAPIGESLLLPIGIHLANDRQGNLPLSLLASASIAGTGIFLALASEEPYILLSIPIVQLIACTEIELSTSRFRE